MQGLMQSWALTADKIIDHAARWHAHREVVTRSVEGPITRTSYSAIHQRAKKVSCILLDLGIKRGDRIGTLAWNTSRHMEVWYGIMGIGAICHTLNPRLFAEQLIYIINHAGDRVIFTDITFLPLLNDLRGRLESVEAIIVLGNDVPGACGALVYEKLIQEAKPEAPWGGFEENEAAGLCYTSGTTGRPKGVLYSHRSNFLHTLSMAGVDVFGLSARDTVLMAVPMFHANGWGLAFLCPALGCKVVLPGPKLDGRSIYELLEGERVTFTAGVPTAWQMLLAYLRESGEKLSTLTRIGTGGSAVPEALVRAFRDEYGVRVIHAWGMTETSPIGTASTPTGEFESLPEEAQHECLLTQGRATVLVDMKIVDDNGERLPHDGKAQGRLMVRGPFVASQYFCDGANNKLDAQGFFDTGDVATIDRCGFMKITDRAKDIIKSGGEWISSIEIENLVMAHEKVELAAVIGVAHEKWLERPLLIVKLRSGRSSTKAEILGFLAGKVAAWWMPDEVMFVDEVPLGPTGKIDKKIIRAQLGDYRLPA